MDKIEGAIQAIHKLDYKSAKNSIHPLIKLLLTVLYIILLTSINKYDIMKTIAMGIYLLIINMFFNIPIKEFLKRFKIIFILLIFIGIANPILDRTVITFLGIIPITTGFISMITLILKGFFSIIASYFLIYTTSIENICYSLKLLHIPNILITIVMLIYRYIILFLKEVQRIWTAYKLRTPNQKGVNHKVWGSMIGSLMIRSIDRANIVYESMELRGFNPDNFFIREIKFTKKDFIFLSLGILILIILRYIPIFELVGNIFV